MVSSPTPGLPRSESAGNTKWRDAAVLLRVTVATIAPRAGEFSPMSLFVDDQWVAYIHRAGFGDSAQVGLTSVGFVAGLKAWFLAVGFSETSAQLPAFVIGCVTPGLLYLVVRRWIGWPFGLLAAGLLTANQLHITYSYHVKQYTLEVLAGVIIFHLAWRWMEAPTRRRLWALDVRTCTSAVR